MREYWLIDPMRKRAEFYQRDRSGMFRLVEVGRDGVYHSKVFAGSGCASIGFGVRRCRRFPKS